MKRTTVLAIVLILGPGTAFARPEGSDPQNSFQEFRKGLYKNYNDFRDRLKEQYADFLEGEWHPYEPLISPKRDDTPKPVKQPKKSDEPAQEKPSSEVPVAKPHGPKPSVARPSSEVPQTPKPSVPKPEVKKPEVPKPEVKKPEVPRVPTPEEIAASHKPADTPKPVNPASEDPSANAEVETFNFYGMPIEIGMVRFNILNNVSKTEDAAAQWKTLQKNGSATEAANVLDAKAKEMGLNGYLAFRLAEAYMNHKFPNANEGARMSAVHYMLVSMGYDARLALNSNGTPLILLPMEQTVYGSIFLNLNGRPYTAFGPDGYDQLASGGLIRTCTLPDMKGDFRKMDLKLNGLNLPYKPKAFDLKGAGLELKGDVNENMFRMIYRYPQMPTEDYAISVLEPSVRDSIVSQIKEQLGAKSEKDAVTKLLSFFHEALEYETDDKRHGFEKPYFLEETLYYDKCDCEDRAIMFTWLAWNALGVENQLLAYPGHESAAVHLKSVSPGEIPPSYNYKGRPYWSTDPTYIGAGIGDVMRAYQTTAPEVDLEFK